MNDFELKNNKKTVALYNKMLEFTRDKVGVQRSDQDEEIVRFVKISDLKAGIQVMLTRNEVIKFYYDNCYRIRVDCRNEVFLPAVARLSELESIPVEQSLTDYTVVFHCHVDSLTAKTLNCIRSQSLKRLYFSKEDWIYAETIKGAHFDALIM